MTADFDSLPPLALSVRQPWAWAIIHGGKVIENRSAGAIRAGRMTMGPIAIHAAAGLKREEFKWGLWRLSKHGVRCPPPDELVRSAIIGAVDVVDIVSESDSEWFGGQCGLVLANPVAVEPIPAKGALGYFAWQRSGDFAPVKPWMRAAMWRTGREEAAGKMGETGDLFPDLAPSFADTPERPSRKPKPRD